MSRRKNIKDGIQQAIRETGVPQETEIVTADDLTHSKLDAVISALGGSVNTTATIFNVPAAVAGTEYSQALPANTKSFIIRSRNKSSLQLAYTSGASGTTYLTIPPGASYEDSNLYTAQTIYFQASKSAETIEIIAYT